MSMTAETALLIKQDVRWAPWLSTVEGKLKNVVRRFYWKNRACVQVGRQEDEWDCVQVQWCHHDCIIYYVQGGEGGKCKGLGLQYVKRWGGMKNKSASLQMIRLLGQTPMSNSKAGDSFGVSLNEESWKLMWTKGNEVQSGECDRMVWECLHGKDLEEV